MKYRRPVLMPSKMPWLDETWDPPPRERTLECRHCGAVHTTTTKNDELIWWCIDALTHSFTKCRAWQKWIKLSTGSVEPTMEEEALVTMAMMSETKEERRSIAVRLLKGTNGEE